MGCWQETEAITHTSIIRNESVVMVILTKEGAESHWWLGSWSDLPEYIMEIHKGTYDDYGWINELSFHDTDYGRRRDDARTVFFRQSVWDEICRRSPPGEKCPKWAWEGESPQYLGELIKVMNFGAYARLHLGVGLAYKGMQQNYWHDKKFYDFYRELEGDAWGTLELNYIDNGGTIKETDHV